MKLDPEVQAMNEAINYMEKADGRTRERYIHHLVHRYFPKGSFVPEKRLWKIDSLSDKDIDDLTRGHDE